MVQLQIIRRLTGVIALALLSASLQAGAAQAVKSLPSETPAKFTPNLEEFDHTKREVMIRMRDGVKLKTLILIPSGASKAPIMLTRTPYNAGGRVARFNSPHLAAAVPQMSDTAVAAGYIIVYQDVRGKFGSEGDYVLTRPLRGPLKGGSRHGLLRHDRVAGKERSGEQRPCRHHRRIVRGIHHRHVHRESASRAEGGRAVCAHGRRLDGR